MRTNAQFSFAGRLITVDYEFALHSYHNKSELKQQGLVPVEMYPYAVTDVHVGYVHLDSEFGAADLSEILCWASKALAEEPAEE
jgi:hypothetical protein